MDGYVDSAHPHSGGSDNLLQRLLAQLHQLDRLPLAVRKFRHYLRWGLGVSVPARRHIRMFGRKGFIRLLRRDLKNCPPGIPTRTVGYSFDQSPWAMVELLAEQKG